jgi:hyperosmotically inducible periplasmic protein
MKQILVALGLAGCLAALGGCTQQEKAEVRNDAQNAGQKVEQGAKTAGKQLREAAGQAGKAVEGATVTARVKGRLLTEKGLENTKIDVDSTGHSVVLKGTVQNKQQAELAERVAAKTEGVEKVTNSLTIVPAGKPTNP